MRDSYKYLMAVYTKFWNFSDKFLRRKKLIYRVFFSPPGDFASVWLEKTVLALL
jgi:hypothetical protein